MRRNAVPHPLFTDRSFRKGCGRDAWVALASGDARVGLEATHLDLVLDWALVLDLRGNMENRVRREMDYQPYVNDHQTTWFSCFTCPRA